jgi:acetyl esterase/lipase
MIFVHGGGWQKGDKGNVLYKPSAFNAEGYIFISMNYRQVPEVDVPAQAGDIARAIAWVYAHAADYGGDPQRIFLMGHSAGAHLVSLVGTDPTYLEAEELSLANLSGVVSLDTQTYDIPGLMSIPVQPGGRIYRQAFGSDPQLWEQLSPYYYITEDSGMPPFQVAYTGSGEERAEQSERFVQALQDAGILAELLPAEEKTHTEINREFGMPGDAVTQAVFEFLNKLAYGGEE